MSVKPEPHDDPLPAMSPSETQGENGHKEILITPSKRPRGKQHEEGTVDSDEESPSKKGKAETPSKRGRGLGSIPTSYEETSEEDKIILRMREKEGKGWAEIRHVVEDLTGVKLHPTTVNKRYARLKANFVVFEETDIPVLLQRKKEIESRFEVEKWQKIADGIESTTGNKYPSSVIQKKSKELAKKGNYGLGDLGVQEE